MASQKGNLLLVDDEPGIVKRIEVLLSEYADKVFTAFNGRDALKILSENKIHCVVCDINMPEMDGVEVIKEVRAKNNEVPFIFFTGHGSRDLMMEVVKYGAFDFLDKPNLENLEEVVQRGLKEGIGEHVIIEKGDFISEFQRILDEVKKK